MAREDQRDAEVGGQAKCKEELVVAGKRVATGVGDHQRLAGDEQVLTERPRQRHLPG
jgi:hypothetical protein